MNCQKTINVEQFVNCKRSKTNLEKASMLQFDTYVKSRVAITLLLFPKEISNEIRVTIPLLLELIYLINFWNLEVAEV